MSKIKEGVGLVFQSSFLKSKKGYSLIELLVTISILLVLFTVAIIYYNGYLKGVETTFAKSEMTNILKFAKTAWSTDGDYHQFIYTMGYVPPKGKQFATVGTDAIRNTVCCNKYQNCIGKGFLHYDCNLTNQLINNIDICTHTGKCTFPGLQPLTTNDFRPPPPVTNPDFKVIQNQSDWCDCNSFTVGGKTLDGIILTLKTDGTLATKN